MSIDKVIWREGLFLQPQHLEHTERFLRDSLNKRIENHIQYCYGLNDYVVDSEGVTNGMFSLSRCSGIMADGTVFELEEETLPASRPVDEHFGLDKNECYVYLSLPLQRDGKANVSPGGSSSEHTYRYMSKAVSVADEVTGQQKKDIDTGVCNFSFLFSDESRDNYSALPVARLIRNEDGKIIVDTQYIPPILNIGASKILMQRLKALLELLFAKAGLISQSRKETGGGAAEFSSTDLTSYHLMTTINTYAPLINHCHLVYSAHPFELFSILTQLTGALCVVSSEINISQLPRYDHNKLAKVFETFNRMIRTILEFDVSKGCFNMPVEKAGAATYVCNITNERLFSKARFFFGVSADVPEKELIINTLQRIKICSRDRLEILIPSAMPGLSLVHTPSPPEELATKSDFIYFSLDQRGELWEGIKASKNIAFYFPNKFSNLKMEMIALKN